MFVRWLQGKPGFWIAEHWPDYTWLLGCCAATGFAVLFLFRRVELPRRPKRRSTSLMVAGSAAAPARICCTANSNLFSARCRLAESKRVDWCSVPLARCNYIIYYNTMLYCRIPKSWTVAGLSPPYRGND